MLYLRTLGGLSLENEGKPRSGAAGQRAPLALLAFIAMHENGATRDRIAATFWPESDSERAHGSLKQALYSLRRDAGAQDLITGTTTLKLNSEVVTCDAVEFNHAIASKDLERATAGYSGDFLDGIHLTGNDEFERWLERERSLLSRAHTSALETLATHADASSRFHESVKWWHRLAIADPLSARIARKYMRALAAVGDRNAAVEFGELHQRMVAAELSAAPDRKTAELIDDIRNGRIDQFEQAADSIADDSKQPVKLAQELDQSSHTTSNSSSRRVLVIFATVVIAVVLIAGYWSSRPGDGGSRSNFAAVALLPCQNLDRGNSLSYVGDRWTEELIDKLVRVAGLRPKPFPSVSRYRTDTRKSEEIAAELNAGSLVRCKVGEWADRVRLVIQMIDATNDEVIWSRDYIQPAGVDAINSIQSSAALDIARFLKVDVTSSALMDVDRPITKDSAALRLYRMGRHLMNEGSPEAMNKSFQYFRQAIERDSTLALAWVGLAETIGFGAGSHVRPASEVQPETERYLRKALSIDERIPEAHSLLALYYSEFAFDSLSAAYHHRRALELNPNSVDAHLWKGFDFYAWEQPDSALLEYQRALELDPMQPWARMHIARLYVFSGQYDRADPLLKQTSELFRDQPPIAYLTAVSLIGKGLNDSAVKVLDRAPRTATFGYLYGMAGRRDIARQILDSLMTASKNGPLNPADIAQLHMGLGNKEEAILWLQRAYTERIPDVRYLLGPELPFRSIRKDPRIQELRRKMGFHRP